MADEPRAISRVPAPIRQDDLDALLPVRRVTRRRIWWKLRVSLPMAIVAVLALVGLLSASPTARGHVLGTADLTTVTVESVELSADQGKPSRERRNGPQWDVTVSINGRSATDEIRSHERPWNPGDRMEVWASAGSDRVEIPRNGEAVAMWLFLGALTVVALVAGGWSVRTWRRRVDFVQVVTREVPTRVEVLRRVDPPQDRERWIRGETVSVTYLSRVPAGFGGTLFLDRVVSGGNPQLGSEYDVWAVGPDRSGPFLIRTLGGGTCWTADGSLQLPGWPVEETTEDNTAEPES